MLFHSKSRSVLYIHVWGIWIWYTHIFCFQSINDLKGTNNLGNTSQAYSSEFPLLHLLNDSIRKILFICLEIKDFFYTPQWKEKKIRQLNLLSQLAIFLKMHENQLFFCPKLCGTRCNVFFNVIKVFHIIHFIL